MHLVCVVRNFLYLSKRLSNALITKHLAKGHLSGRNTYPFANPLPNGGKLRTADLSDANAYTNLETDA